MDDIESPFQPSMPDSNHPIDQAIEAVPEPVRVDESLDDMVTALRVQLRSDQRRRLARDRK